MSNKPIDAGTSATLALSLPDWVRSVLASSQPIYSTCEERMHFVIELARMNIVQATGGPFGAAVFDLHTRNLIAVGVNRVIPASCSAAHAEILALSLAQQSVGHHDLGHGGLAFELVTSTEPCAMCLGALPFSGIQRVTCGARDEDAREVGFDEGAKPLNWSAILEERGITVIRDRCRDEARRVLHLYAKRGGVIY